MKNKIKNIVRPFTDKTETLKAYDKKIDDVTMRLETLNKIEPLDMTLEQYIERNQAIEFIQFIQKNRGDGLSLKIGDNSPFHKIGYLMGCLMEQNEELIAVAEHFTAGEYQEVYERVYSEVYGSVADSISELIEAYKYHSPNTKWENHLLPYLPKPLNQQYIENRIEYKRETGKSDFELPIVIKASKPNF